MDVNNIITYIKSSLGEFGRVCEYRSSRERFTGIGAVDGLGVWEFGIVGRF